MDAQVPQSFGQVIAPFLPVLTPATILLVVWRLTWRARGMVDTFNQVKDVQLKQIQTTLESNTAAITEQTKEIKSSVESQNSLIRDEFRDLRKTFTDYVVQLAAIQSRAFGPAMVGARAKRNRR